LLNPFFSRGGVAKHELAIRQVAGEVIDQFITTGAFEMVEDFASPFTAATLCRVILNLDDDDLMRTASAKVQAIGHANSAAAWLELTGFLTELIRAHRLGSRDGVLDAILAGSINDIELTEEQKLGIVIVLFLGGLDTTRAQITCIARHLALDQGLEDRLRNPSWIRTDLDEFLRHDSVVTALAREVTRDTELDGIGLHAGDRLLVHYYSANHDAERFENPEQLAFDRTRNPHAAFGLGIHRCLGSNLARLQIEVAFDELLRRVENLRVADGATIAFLPGIARMPASLPLTFDRRR
jgi:cytochrome P450